MYCIASVGRYGVMCIVGPSTAADRRPPASRHGRARDVLNQLYCVVPSVSGDIAAGILMDSE